MIGRGIKANSYFFRVSEVNAIYDQYARIGLTNREIWLRYIYPRFGISERTYYNYLKRGECKEMGY